MDFPKKQAQRLMPLYLLEYNEKLFENHPDPEAPWGGGGSDYTAGYGIDITNDQISIDQDIVATKNELNGYIKDNDLNYSATFRGKGVYVKEEGAYTATSYGDGAIARSIPHQPGYTYELPNQSGTIALTSDIPSLTNYVTTTQLEDALDDYALKTDIPENVSDLNNDAGYTTQTWVENQGYLTGINSSDVIAALGYTPGTSNFSGNYNDLTNKPDLSIYAESADLATVATTGDYSDLQNKPNIPVSTSDLINDSGYITKSVNNLDNYTLTSSLAAVATSGSYNDLTDTPTIGQGVLTIQVNGVKVKQFSANETAAKTANIIVPTKTSDLTNDSGFITSSDIPNNLCKYIDLGSGSYAPVITQTILDTIATSPKDYVLLYNFTYQGATYCIKFQYMNTVNGYYFYQSYNVGKVVNNTLTECSMAFTMTIRISDGTPTITSEDTTPTAGTGIRITGHSISVDSLTVAMKSDLPTVNDPTITFTQGGVTKGSITLNQSSNQTIALDAAGSSYSAGAGIDITNNEISIDNTVALKSELFSGDYNDLTNKPTIPTVNDNTITITQGGVTKGSFTLNQNTNQTIEVDDVPGMIGEVIFSTTPTNGTATYNINLSKDITQYDYIEVYYNDNDDTIRRFCSKFQEPSIGNKITLTSYLNNSTPRLYTKDTVYSIATTTSLTLDSSVQQRISNNAATTVSYATTEMHCRPYKIIGYKQNSAPIVIPDIYYKNGDTYENRNYYQLYGYATNGGKDLQFTVTFNKSLANITSVTVNKITIISRGVSGYVGANSYTDYAADTTNYTVSALISSDNAITITIRGNTAWSNVNNNTPICAVVQNVAGALKLTFNS